jgi:hypothetical protein
VDETVQEYGLRTPLQTQHFDKKVAQENQSAFVPSLHIEIDGDHVQNVHSPGTHFDTSTVLVFDNLLVDNTLRSRLLDVVLGKPSKGDGADVVHVWDDARNGPDPTRWCHGGLLDIPDDSHEEFDGGPCWGLRDDAVIDICYNDHPAITEFESKLDYLFKDFVVTRLPQAVMGASVSPLTANAPTAGDIFDYHIDGDPFSSSPSLWTDIYGKYPNRSLGKPRFVSCLLYLNNDWNADIFGAPTRLWDPPTEMTYDVIPAPPGRCVIMDQDISHTVVAPNAAAGRLPRYSLVWKLILHPKVQGQPMKDLCCGRRNSWPKPIFVGSAAANYYDVNN